MTPAAFPQSNKTLQPPGGMENCVPLQIWTDGRTCVSCWRADWRERLSILFFGRVWIWVWFGATQPPIQLLGHRNIFGTQRAPADDVQ